jgi:glucose-6-phosphate 1-epimerase
VQTFDDLARDFSADGAAWERGPGDLPFLVVQNDRCAARLTPYGAQLCEWTPVGQASSVLFVSPRATFEAGKAIRGGVPVCFPWFAAHPSDPTKPAHGFARTRLWEVTDVIADDAGQVHVALRLAADERTRALWDAEFTASLSVTLGATLTMTLDIENRSGRPIAYESALHTYLAVGDVEKVRIHGLERTRFIDKVDGMQEKVAGAEPLALTGDTDRVFLDTTAPCTVDDPVLGRRVRVEKGGSLVTVVWNPGREKGQAVPDIGDAWRRFVCVETASCGPHAIRLAPGARHAMTATINMGGSGRPQAPHAPGPE